MKLYTLDNVLIKESSVLPTNFTGVVEYYDGTKEWRLNGKFHRLDGPAYETPYGHKEWWVKSKLHRIDGPAVEYPNGTIYWIVEGKGVTELECKLLHDIMKLKGLL